MNNSHNNVVPFFIQEVVETWFSNNSFHTNTQQSYHHLQVDRHIDMP
jgi:hypothetical protein